MEDELYDFLYRTVFTAVIALFIFLEVYDYVDPGLITRGNVFAVIAVSISFNALLLLYRRVRMYMIPAVLLVGIILYFLIDRNDVVMIIESVVFSIMMISLASFVLFLICDRVPVLNMIVAGGAFIYMIVQLFTGYGLHKASPALVMFYVLAVLTGITRNGIRRILPENARRARQYMTFLIPFLLAFLLLLVVFPKPKNPISWKWVQNLYEYTSDKIETLMHRFSSKYGHVTTSGSFKIAFDVSERMDYDNTGAETIELMEITPDSTVFGGLYLKGEIFNEFKDGQWFNTLESDKDYSRIDAFESYYGVTVYSGLSVNSLLREASVQIRFLDISSPIVFAPVKMNVLRDISVKKDTEYLNEHLLFSGNVSYGSAYSISFLQMNLGNTVFNDYMNSAAAPFDNESFETARKNLRGNYRDMSPELLEEYHDYVKRYYMSTPQIRDSVKEWLEEITTAGLTDYEKLLAVERALASLEYNLNTKAIPDYVQTEGDFINHFILEKREGFCVHYATVFCLLARYMGYPARVIRGYKTQTVYNETTVVNNSCGHAWPEVYFEGRGWIPFEPTPGMAVERYAGWTVKSGKLKDEDTFRAGKQDNVPALPEEDVEYEREHI
ncbi:MAG: hypothetical protein J6Y89_00775, partial [Lachnospiraceae bacterium]|nr:hypothetical protein [Lachnospiraceae bacterium]